MPYFHNPRSRLGLFDERLGTKRAPSSWMIALVQDGRLRRRSFYRHIMTRKPKALTLPRPPTAFHLKAQGREPRERTLGDGRSHHEL
jgi:hypothetical protein